LENLLQISLFISGRWAYVGWSAEYKGNVDVSGVNGFLMGCDQGLYELFVEILHEGDVIFAGGSFSGGGQDGWFREFGDGVFGRYCGDGVAHGSSSANR
jgi:hypothetical protein